MFYRSILMTERKEYDDTQQKMEKISSPWGGGSDLCLQAMTVMAGTRGAAVPDQGGPGVVSQQEQENASEAGQQEQAGSGHPAETGAANAAAANPIHPTASRSGHPAALEVNYSAFIVQNGWSAVTEDNRPYAAPANSWVTAVRANLIQIPGGGLQVGIRYQVNLSGYRWLDWAQDGVQTGGTDKVMPLKRQSAWN